MARRSAGRHTRRVRRATPRRWLPFLALVAVAGAAVVVTNADDDPTAPSRVEAPAAQLPVAAEPGALSTAWYCSGSSRGADGPAELSVVIANVAERGATAEIVVSGTNGERRRTTVDVPAAGRTRVAAADLLTAGWVGMTVEVLGGRATVTREVSGPTGIDVSPCSSNASDRWYVPSGSTVQGAEEHLVLYNPFPDTTSVDISFATDAGRRAPQALQGFSVPGRSVRVVPVEALPAARPELATRVVARTGRLVVDRVQTYDGTGEPVAGTGETPVETPAPTGLAATPAVPAAGTRWLFPQVVNTPGTRTQIAIDNPSGRDASIDLVVTFENPDLVPEVEPIQVDIAAEQQDLIDLTDLAELTPGAPYQVEVRSLSGARVVAEQLVFGAVPPADPVTVDPDGGGEAEPDPDAEGEPQEADPEADPEAEAVEASDGLSVVSGSPVAASRWLLASRGGSSQRTSSVVVANPGAEDVSVTVSQAVQGNRSTVASAAVVVPAGDRRVLDLRDATINPALLVTADGPVVVSHDIVQAGGLGISQSLATPLPETVVVLPGG